jgi:cyanate permease
LALGLMAGGLGLGAIAVPVIAQRLIASFGWRGSYATFGCATLLISLPVVAAVLRESPGRSDRSPARVVPGATAVHGIVQDEGLDWREIWHHRTFWLMICSFVLAGASLHACVLHMPALLTDRGVSAGAAAAVSSLVGAALLVGRIGAGYLLDRMFAPRLAMFFFGAAAVGIGLLLGGVTGPSALAAAFLIGIGMGAEVDIIAYLMSRYFGLRTLGTAFGVSFGSYMVAGALGVFLMGAGYDVSHSKGVHDHARDRYSAHSPLNRPNHHPTAPVGRAGYADMRQPMPLCALAVPSRRTSPYPLPGARAPQASSGNSVTHRRAHRGLHSPSVLR